MYESVSPDGEPAVLKLVPKDRGAERELLFEELGDTPNVIPILTTGEYEGHWVLAMPRAEMSLREYLNRRDCLEPAEARAILADIVTALAALDGRVVHRDLKPDNVLRWNDAWCLADFGIARYAEQTTAPDTRKFSKTPHYAAPEQWRFERATAATDIYALGVLAYEMLAGVRPFQGPNAEDFRDQHLHETASPLAEVPPGLAGLVTQCLMKPPGARPSPAELLPRLQTSEAPASRAAARLQQANLNELQRRAAATAEVEAERTEAKRQEDLYGAATGAILAVQDAMREELLRYVPTAAPSQPDEWPFQLNGAELRWVPVQSAAGADWAQYHPAFDVIAYAGIELTIPPTYGDWRGRSHSLWYCDAQQPGSFRWYETAFFPRSKSVSIEPALLPPDYVSGRALSRVVLPSTDRTIRFRARESWQVARPFAPIDQDDSADFIDRWLGWFAEAVDGSLRPLDRLPETEPRDSYRTSH